MFNTHFFLFVELYFQYIFAFMKRYGIGEIQKNLGIGNVIAESVASNTPIIVTNRNEDVAMVMPLRIGEIAFLEYCLERYRNFFTVVGVNPDTEGWLKCILAEEILGERAKSQRLAVEAAAKRKINPHEVSDFG